MGEDSPGAFPRVQLFGGFVGRGVWPRLVYWLVSWVPLVVLTGLSSPDAMATFLSDAEALARLLVGVPALLIGGNFVDRHLTRAGDELHAGGLLASSSCGALQRQLTRWGEGRLLWVVLPTVVVAALSINAFEESTHALRGWRQDGEGYSPAGVWYRWVSSTAYRYLWLRLVWGLILWLVTMRFLARVLEPCLLHPDRLGGLGRFIEAHAAFAPVVFGLSGSAAGSLVNQLLHRGRSFDDVQMQLIAFVVTIQLPILVTPLPLAVPLYLEKRRLLRRLSTVVVPWARWVAPHLEAKLPPPSPVTHDLAAHADLIAAYSVVDQTTIVPLKRRFVVTLALFTLLPMLPVLLIGIPFQDLWSSVKRLL